MVNVSDQIVTRDAKEYEVANGTIAIAQIETVGKTLGLKAPTP